MKIIRLCSRFTKAESGKNGKLKKNGKKGKIAGKRERENGKF
jgi:hypothetical protein